ncbi:Protein Simiate, partial [Bienertia sinuspersici]
MTEVLETEEYALNSLSKTSLIPQFRDPQFKDKGEDEELKRLLLHDISTPPLSPPSVVETNFVRYFAVDFMKLGHDQDVYRHANGLCVIGLAITHVALQTKDGVTYVDFNVGKSDRSKFKVTGNRKK